MSEIESEVQRILRGIKQNYSNDSNNIYQSIQQDLLVYSQGKQEITVDQLRLFFTDRKGDINEEQIKHLLEKIPHDNQGIYLIQSVQQTFNSVSGKYPIINRNVQVQEENKQNNNDNSSKKEQSNDKIKEGGENEMDIENVILIQDDDDEEEDKTILEDGFESLNQKLGQLKEKHIKKEIDLNDIKNMFPDKKMIKFSELVFFLSSYGVDLKSQEEFYLKQTLLDDEKQDSIFIKDFLEFMNLKDNYIQKQQNQNNNNNQNMNNNNNQLPPPPNLYQSNKNNNNFPIIKPDVNYNNQNQNNRYGIDNNNYYPPPPFPAVPQPNQINSNPNMMIPNHMQQLYNQMYNNLYHPNNNFNNNNNNNNFNNNNQYNNNNNNNNNNNYNNNNQNINNNQQIQQNQILNNQNQKNNNNNNNNSNNINNYNLNNNNNQINNDRNNNYMLNSQCEQFEQTDEQIQGYEEFQLKFYDCQVNNKEYIDTEFPPSEDSIANDKTSKHYYEWRQLGWYRPVGFFKGEEYSMFDKFKSMSQSRIGLGQFITPNDIQQGMLGDCYFLSALSCLAQEPHRILNLFLTRQTNKYGIYCIKICHDGEWKAVVIDDHIPCYHQRPAFTKANGNELWVLLIEKAWAKLFKSYSRIESGHCNQALRDLTGAPTANFMTYESTEVNGYEVQQMNQNLLPILYDALNETNRYLITASNDSADLTKSQADRLGLVTSHAYSIIGFKEITHPKLGKVTLVRLRNPWGKKEWKGDWSDGSPLWTAELKEKLRIKQRQDGIFYMSVEDFYKYFVQITICYYHDFFKYTSQKIHQSDGKHSQYFTMKIKTSGTYYISIIQPDKRNFDKDIHYEIGKSRIFVGQMLDQNGQQHIKYIGSFQKKTREVFVECNLEPGVNVIQSKVSWDLPVSTSYVISSYGVDTTEIKPIQKQYLPPSYIEECFKYHARKNSSLKMHGSLMKCFHLDHKQGYGYYYFQNIANQAYQINITFQQHKGLKFKKPQRVPKIQCIAIPQTECIAIFTIDHQGYALQYTENTSQLF